MYIRMTYSNHTIGIYFSLKPANPAPFPVEKPETDCSSPKFSSIVDGNIIHSDYKLT